jgi:hypothetical protein
MGSWVLVDFEMSNSNSDKVDLLKHENLKEKLLGRKGIVKEG